MDTYIFQADLLCAECAKKHLAVIEADGIACSDIEDSNYVPQGPFSDGGGEADSPQHCSECGTFLENPLTLAGYQYVRDMASDKTSHSDVIREWLAWYDISDESDD